MPIKDERIALRLESSLHKKLMVLAKRNGKKLSAYIRLLLIRGIQEPE